MQTQKPDSYLRRPVIANRVEDTRMAFSPWCHRRLTLLACVVGGLLMAISLSLAQLPWKNQGGPWHNNPAGYARDIKDRYAAKSAELGQKRKRLRAISDYLNQLRVGGVSAGIGIVNEGPALIEEQDLIREVAKLAQELNDIENEWDSTIREAFGPMPPLSHFTQADGGADIERIDSWIRWNIESKNPVPLERLGVITYGGDARITRAATSTAAGGLSPGFVLFQHSGKFDTQPGPEGVLLGPKSVSGPCHIIARVVGTPAVQGTWTMYNNNTGMNVTFDRSVGYAGYQSETILTLRGEKENNDLTAEADLSGPGRLWVWISRPKGSGPLSGSFFEQSYQASVTVTGITPDWPSTSIRNVQSGDRLTTGNRITGIRLADGSHVVIQPNSEVEITQVRPGIVEVDLLRGKMRWTSLDPKRQEEYHGVGPRTQVAWKGIVMRPAGTDYLVEGTDDTGRILVVSGAVSLGNGAIVVKAGQQYSWPSGKITTFDTEAAGPPEFAGVPLTPEYNDDGVPQPYGSVVGNFSNDAVSDGWLWEDPGNDVTLETPTSGVLRLTVPNGNELFQDGHSAGRLLHKVTGDFMLEAQMELTTNATDWVGADFLVKAPGSYLGFQKKQMTEHNPAASYALIGTCLVRLRDGTFRTGQPGVPLSDGPILADGRARVRLMRRGNIWRQWWSPDGRRWQIVTSDELALPETLWVGWVFKRVAHDGNPSEPGIFTVRDVTLTTSPLGVTEEPGLITSAKNGDMSTQDGVITLTLDGSAVGNVNVYTTGRLTGDFDLSVSFDTGEWTHQPGEARFWGIDATSTDEKNRVYIAGFVGKDTGERQRYCTDLQIGGRWGNYGWDFSEDRIGKLRLVRKDGEITSHYWKNGTWVRRSREGVMMQMPLHLRFIISNEPKAERAVPFSVKFKIEELILKPLEEPDNQINQEAEDRKK